MKQQRITGWKSRNQELQQKQGVTTRKLSEYDSLIPEWVILTFCSLLTLEINYVSFMLALVITRMCRR